MARAVASRHLSGSALTAAGHKQHWGKHVQRLRRDEYSALRMMTVINECHGKDTFGFDFLNWAFFQTCHRTMIPWSYVGFWPSKRSVWKNRGFLFATQITITTLISSGTGVRSGSSWEYTTLHSLHTVFLLFILLFFYFFWKDQCDIWQVFSSFFITKLLSVTPPTCSFCAPVYRMFSGWSIVDRWHWATSAKEFLYLRCAQYLQTWVKFCKGEWE